MNFPQKVGRRVIAVRAAAGFAFLLAVVPAVAARKTAFELSTIASRQLIAEPSLAIDRSTTPNIVYYLAPEGPTQVYRSLDDGLTFTKGASTDEPADADLAVDADGLVYVTTLFGSNGQTTIPVSTSLDHGLSFARTVETFPQGSDSDREWISAQGHGHVVLTLRDLTTSTFRAFVSTDAAPSFTGPIEIDQQIDRGGRAAFGPDGTLYAAFSAFPAGGGANVLRVAKSQDGGVTWHRFTVAPVADALANWPSTAVDDAGVVYATWATGKTAAGNPSVFLSRSGDGGVSWSDPIIVSDPARTALFPWVVAGRPGHAAVAYFTSRPLDGLPDPGNLLGGPQTSWDVEIARTGDGVTWSRVVAAPDIHRGSVCTINPACSYQAGAGGPPRPLDRRLFDFFEAALDSSGRLLVAYPEDRPLTSGEPNDAILAETDLRLARQFSMDTPASGDL